MKQVQVSGRLGADPELKRVGGNDTPLLEQDLAVDDWDHKTSMKTTCWVPIVVWGKSAEFVCNYAKKGDALVVNGELCSEEYVSKKFTDENGNGAKMKRWYVKAAMGGVQLYSRGEGSAAGSGAPQDKPAATKSRPPVDEDDIPF